MNEVGVLKDKGDYVEMAQLAIDAGVPAKPQAIVQKGMDAGVLKSADKTEQGRYDRLLASATQAVRRSTARARLSSRPKPRRPARARCWSAWVRPI